jgi:hypothetical protein
MCGDALDLASGVSIREMDVLSSGAAAAAGPLSRLRRSSRLALCDRERASPADAVAEKEDQ